MPLPQRVLLFLIDGLRPDAINQTDTPSLHRLMAEGAFTLSAQTVFPELSLPCHTSMFYGIPPEEHGIHYNDWQPIPGNPPGLIDLIKASGRSTAAVYSWEPLRDLSRPDSLDFTYYHRHTAPENDGRELELAAVAADYLVREEPAFTFVYIEVVDLLGHLSGWMSPEYLDAVTRADRALELVLDELEGAALLDSTAILATADHGGHGHRHGPLFADDVSQPEDAAIPWILRGAGVRRGAELDGPVNLMDTAPTLLALLGLEFPTGRQGKVVREALEA